MHRGPGGDGEWRHMVHAIRPHKGIPSAIVALGLKILHRNYHPSGAIQVLKVALESVLRQRDIHRGDSEATGRTPVPGQHDRRPFFMSLITRCYYSYYILFLFWL